MAQEHDGGAIGKDTVVIIGQATLRGDDGEAVLAAADPAITGTLTISEGVDYTVAAIGDGGGCGTGLLAIAAAKLGVAKVVAVDENNLACQVARANVIPDRRYR